MFITKDLKLGTVSKTTTILQWSPPQTHNQKACSQYGGPWHFPSGCHASRSTRSPPIWGKHVSANMDYQHSSIETQTNIGDRQTLKWTYCPLCHLILGCFVLLFEFRFVFWDFQFFGVFCSICFLSGCESSSLVVVFWWVWCCVFSSALDIFQGFCFCNPTLDTVGLFKCWHRCQT